MGNSDQGAAAELPVTVPNVALHALIRAYLRSLSRFHRHVEPFLRGFFCGQAYWDSGGDASPAERWTTEPLQRPVAEYQRLLHHAHVIEVRGEATPST